MPKKKAKPRKRKPKRLSDPFYQIGKRKSVARDRKIKAKPSGKRKSKSGRIYTERRRNRSDKPPTWL